jgi:hypothetical protein
MAILLRLIEGTDQRLDRATSHPLRRAPLKACLLQAEGMGCLRAWPDFAANDLATLHALEQPVPATYALYGRDLHRARAAIHSDGLNKSWSVNTLFDVPCLLGRLPAQLHEGLRHRRLDLPEQPVHLREPSKNGPALPALHDELIGQFDTGRPTAVEWEEIAERLELSLLV